MKGMIVDNREDEKGLGAADEVWLPMPDHAGLYEVSSEGRVRSLYFSPARVLRTGRDSHSYPTIMLTKGGKRRPFTLHRMVCRAFHGEPTILHNEAAHLNGNRIEARASNLQWVSKVENRFHQRAHGTHQAGEKHPCARLTEADVREISAIGVRSTAKALGLAYGVSPHTIQDIRSKRRWRHILSAPIAQGGQHD